MAEQELAVEFDPERGRWTVLGTAAEVRMTQNQQEIIDALKTIGCDAQPHEVAKVLGKSREAVKKIMLRMGHNGLLRCGMGAQYGLPNKKDSLNNVSPPSKV